MTISFNDYYYHSAAYVEMYPRYAQHSIILVATFSCNLPGFRNMHTPPAENLYNRFENRLLSLSLCLRSYTPPRNRPVCFFNAFFSNGDKFNSFPCKILLRNLIRRLKKNKREIKYFLGLYIYIVHRFQIQFEQRPNINCPNEAAFCVPVSFGNLIMPTFNYDTRAHIMTALTY